MKRKVPAGFEKREGLMEEFCAGSGKAHVRRLRFECCMLQTAWEDEEGMLRWRDVSCTDPDDFQALRAHAWDVGDFELHDKVLMMPSAAEVEWSCPAQMLDAFAWKPCGRSPGKTSKDQGRGTSKGAGDVRQACTLNLALAHLKLSQWDDAIGAASDAIGVQKDCRKGFYRRGLGHKGKGDLQKAAADLRKALELDESDSAVRASLEEVRASLEEKEALEGTLGHARRADAEAAERAMNAALSEAAEREKRAVQDAVARTTQEARETRAALEAELAKERDARRADKSQFESRVAYGKEILGQKDAKLTQLAARLNKAEREATFLRQSRASPASAGGSGRDAKLEASHKNLEREYDLLRRKLNAALDRAAKQLDADVSDDGDQLRLYAGRVRQLEAQLQEKTMAAAVAAREAHDARCAAAEAGADLQDAKFEATRLKGDVARAELGRTPFRASARKSPRASPRGTAGFPLHDDEAAELTVTLDTYVPPEKPKPSVSDRLAALRAERAAEKPRGLRAANSPPAPVARKVRFDGAAAAAKENAFTPAR